MKYEGITAKNPPCPKRTLKTPLPQQRSSSISEEESQWISVEDRRKRRVAFEEVAKRMLGCREDSEDLKVGISILKEQLGISEEAGVSVRQIAQLAMNENGQKIPEISRQGEEEVCTASLARWNTQLKSLAELERKCQGMMQEVILLSERQDVLKGMVEDKIRLQSRGTKKYYEQIFEEMLGLEEMKSKEALLLVQKKHIMMRYQRERDTSRMLQRSRSSRVTSKGVDMQDLLSFESCRSSVVDDMEEVSSESSRKMQDEQEATSEASWNVKGSKEEDGWRLEPDGETETPDVIVFFDGTRRKASL